MAQFSIYGSTHKQGDGTAAGLRRWSRVFLVNSRTFGLLLALGLAAATTAVAGPDSTRADAITRIDPPESDFFSKVVYYRGIPIKSSGEVADTALFAARDRLAMMLTNLPAVCENLRAAHAELHIIGRNQVTSDLPEWRFDKGKPLPEYNGLTIDQRTRGMGGRIASCGEENLLKLEKDRYLGRDICVHEFSHCIYQCGIPRDIRQRFRRQYKASLARGLWDKAYAASNDDEFFAELAMWYFGTHGDLHMTGSKPAAGPAGLKAYDPDAFALFDELFSGRMKISATTRADSSEFEDDPATTYPATAAISIDFHKRGPAINPRMYGIFLEEINHGVDGGLYPELIRNRGFEDSRPPEGFVFRPGAQGRPGRWMAGGYDAESIAHFDYFNPDGTMKDFPFWSLIREGAAQGSMNLDTNDPLNLAGPRSLRLEIDDAGSGRLGIANEGFFGVGVAEGRKYNLSFWARGEGFSGPLTASVEDSRGVPCVNPVTINGVTSQWQQFHATVSAARTNPNARFVLIAGASGKVWLDMISLFPADTFKNRPNGLRPDLARLLADMKPGFVRFPGGCVIEGGSIETAYNWKDSIGPLPGRREQFGPWGYRETHGMGFFEYLQFCEDIGAEPLYVGFAGETCHFRSVKDVPMDQMGWVAANFLDAIEFANGPTTSTWGKLRAEAGHPESFNLKLAEVGNEGQARTFPPRYQFVHSALKSRYPYISYINDYSFIRRGQMGAEPSDIEDNHYYESPNWFMSHANLYDNRDRTLPPIYDGEIAVTSGDNSDTHGTLLDALSEGAFLMGLERNADVVKMVSYAPLLANVNGRTGWHGMIYFDSLHSYATVSYYLWKLFGLNRPDCAIQTEVNYTPDTPADISGGIGVGTWNTAAEFKDIRVEQAGKLLYSSDFSKGANSWRTDGGDWSVVDGAYRQSDEAVGLSYFGDEDWTGYTLTLKARKISGSEGFLIVFGHKRDDKYWWNVGGWGNREHAIEFNQTGVGRHVPGSVETGRWYDLKVQVDGRRIQCFLDGDLIHDVVVPAPDRFFALAGKDDRSGELVLKAINVSRSPVKGQVILNGAARAGGKARLITLSSEKLADNNSMDQPDKVAPVDGVLETAGDHFSYQFPPNSLTILRVPIR
jgi:alpha-L-arabinofuranosidase